MVRANSTPLAGERRLEILDQLAANGSVRVTLLAQDFGVAEETIRRDLDKLSDEGRLTRTHGGAMSVRTESEDLPWSVRKSSRTHEKRAIAFAALSYVEPNDVIALDASTTVMELACLLPDIPLTVITYGLDVARFLADRTQIQVICAGGELDPKSICLLGPIAESNLKQFTISKLFFSSKGIDLERGYSEASTSHASIKEVLLNLAEHSILLADHSKFGVRSMTYSGPIDSADRLITDTRTDANVVEAFERAGVRTQVATATDCLPEEQKS